MNIFQKNLALMGIEVRGRGAEIRKQKTDDRKQMTGLRDLGISRGAWSNVLRANYL